MDGFQLPDRQQTYKRWHDEDEASQKAEPVANGVGIVGDEKGSEGAGSQCEHPACGAG